MAEGRLRRGLGTGQSGRFGTAMITFLFLMWRLRRFGAGSYDTGCLRRGRDMDCTEQWTMSAGSVVWGKTPTHKRQKQKKKNSGRLVCTRNCLVGTVNSMLFEPEIFLHKFPNAALRGSIFVKQSVHECHMSTEVFHWPDLYVRRIFDLPLRHGRSGGLEAWCAQWLWRHQHQFL